MNATNGDMYGEGHPSPELTKHTVSSAHISLSTHLTHQSTRCVLQSMSIEVRVLLDMPIVCEAQPRAVNCKQLRHGHDKIANLVV